MPASNMQEDQLSLAAKAKAKYLPSLYVRHSTADKPPSLVSTDFCTTSMAVNIDMQG